MIQSIVNEVNKEAEEQTYPCIMKGPSRIIVLFESSGCGTVIVRGLEYRIGHYSTEWLMTYFKRFNGSVTLSNIE